MRPRFSSGGFTVVELMIVVAILTILASIAVPIYRGYILGAKTSEAKGNLLALALALEEYKGRTGTYYAPEDVGGTDDKVYRYAEDDSGEAVEDDITSWLDWQPKSASGGRACNYNYEIHVTDKGKDYYVEAIPVRGGVQSLGSFRLYRDGTKEGRW